jgi:hypothetical protein
MTLSQNNIAYVTVFSCAFGGVTVFGSLPIWIFPIGIMLPVLSFNLLMKKSNIDRLLISTMALMVCFSFINFKEFQLSTLLYSLVVTSLFVLTKSKISNCSINMIFGIYKYILLIFSGLIFLGVILYYSLGVVDLLVANIDLSRSIPRSFGPTTEPSYAALILTISMWVITYDNKASIMATRLYLALYLFCIYLIGSGIGYISSLLLLTNFYYSSNTKVSFKEKWFLFIAILLVLPFVTIDIPRLEALSRIFGDIFSYTSFWGVFEAIKVADGAAWFRVGPFIEYLGDIDYNNPLELLVGHGAGTSSVYFGDKYSNHIDPSLFSLYGHSNLNLSFFPAFLYDYGIIISGFVVFFTIRLLFRTGDFTLLLLLTAMVFFNCNYNTSLFWFFMYSIFIMGVINKGNTTA